MLIEYFELGGQNRVIFDKNFEIPAMNMTNNRFLIADDYLSKNDIIQR